MRDFTCGCGAGDVIKEVDQGVEDRWGRIEGCICNLQACIYCRNRSSAAFEGSLPWWVDIAASSSYQQDRRMGLVGWISKRLRLSIQACSKSEYLTVLANGRNPG